MSTPGVKKRATDETSVHVLSFPLQFLATNVN
jgi:hypothetical protein